MGGSTGAALDRVASLGGTLYDRDQGIKKGAEDMYDTLTGKKMEEEQTDTSSANPFSRANLSNSMRRKNKSGFGRRQTFKGLTG